MKLSILKNTTSGFTTYYVGNNIDHVSHLKDCTLICHHDFNPNLINVTLIKSNNPQLDFYKLSHEIKDEYIFHGEIHKEAKIGKNVIISPGCVIGKVTIEDNVEIGANTVIYSKTTIKKGSRIGSNVTIGAEGMMWVWDKDKRVFLKQLGGVIIEEDCTIGSNSAIVRGSANEFTTIKQGSNIAPGCNIGHGSYIGSNTHLANNVTLGGSIHLSNNCFIGCAGIINPGVKILKEETIIGAGCVVTKNITKSGVYAGIPAKYLKPINKKLSGIPEWKK